MSKDVEPEKVVQKRLRQIKYYYQRRDEAKSARAEKTRDPLDFDYQEEFRYSTEEELLDDSGQDESSLQAPEKASCP